MAQVKIRMNRAGITAVLQAAAPHTARLADRVAATIVGAVGEVDQDMVDPRRYNEPTPRRARSAVVLTHPTSKGRQAARDAAEPAMRVAGE